MHVKFCENNFIHGTEKLAKDLRENYTSVEVTIYPCQGYCGDCAKGPYAKVDDAFFRADTVEELSEMVKKLIK